MRVTAMEAWGPRRRRVICTTLAPAEGPPMGEKVGTTEGAAEPGRRSPVAPEGGGGGSEGCVGGGARGKEGGRWVGG